jgi:hypothetical protein
MERGVGIDFGAETFSDDQLGPVQRQFRVKGSPDAALHAMIGP